MQGGSNRAAQTRLLKTRFGGMRQDELEKQLAKEAGLSRAAARDEVGEVVRRVLDSLRKGKATDLPGVGQLAAKRADTGHSKAARK
jgi:nucleoid DNA-binding protein